MSKKDFNLATFFANERHTSPEEVQKVLEWRIQRVEAKRTVYCQAFFQIFGQGQPCLNIDKGPEYMGKCGTPQAVWSEAKQDWLSFPVCNWLIQLARQLAKEQGIGGDLILSGDNQEHAAARAGRKNIVSIRNGKVTIG